MAVRQLMIVAGILLVAVMSGFLLSAVSSITMNGDYYSVQERRMPCGRIMRREVIHQNDAWVKTVTLMDPSGRILATKTRTVESEQCDAIRAGQFVPGLWHDCSV